LGCVIYEMLTGRRAFSGADITDTITSVLRDEPDWAALPSDTPTSVRRLLRRCLAKDRARRLQSAADARLELDDVTTTTEEATPNARVGRPWWHLGAAAGTGAVATGVALAFLAASFTGEPPAQAVRMALSLNVPFPIGVQNEVSISPDGRHLVTGGVGASGIWLHALDGTPSRHLADAAPGNICWSPDGRQLLYPRYDAKFMRFDLAAQASVLFTDAVPNGSTWGCAWSTDGVILNAGGSTIYRTTESGGKWEALSLNDDAGPAMVRLGPAFLPDQRRFLYFVLGESGGGSIRVGSLDSPETTTLLENAVSVASYRDGNLLFQLGSDLVAQPLDLSTMSLSGQAQPVAPRVDPGVVVYPSRFSASNTGVVVHATPKLGVDGILTWFDRTGRNLGTISSPSGAEYINPSLSPDGQMLAANRIDPTTGNWDVWLVDLASGSAKRATTQPGIDSDAVWSPDGKQLAYVSSRREGKGVYSIDIASGVEQQLHACRERCWWMMPTSWTPDGRFVLINTEIGRMEAVTVRKGAGPTPPPFRGRLAVVSPDGRWVAYVDSDSGSNHVFVQAFPGPGPRMQVTRAPGTHPRWRADGRELFFSAEIQKDALVSAVMSVDVAPLGDTLRVSAPRRVFGDAVTHPMTDSRRHADYSPDGQRMLARQRHGALEPPVRLIINWAEPLRQP
jgi:WD40 repeat protein